jgi:hypothetical protein
MAAPRKKNKITISDDSIPEKLFVEREIPIDKFTKHRELVELLPSTCDICGYDVSRSNKLPPYDTMDELAQLKVGEVLKAHKATHLPHETSTVRKESELPTGWSRKPRF